MNQPWWHSVVGISRYLTGPRAETIVQVARVRACLACQHLNKTRETWLSRFRAWFFSSAPIAGWCGLCKCLVIAQSAPLDPVHATLTVNGEPPVPIHAAGKSQCRDEECPDSRWSATYPSPADREA